MIRSTEFAFKEVKLLKKSWASRVWARVSTLSNPERWVVDWFGGGQQSKTGVNVNQDSALRVTAYLAAVKILSEGVASLPLFTYQNMDSGGKQRARGHPAYEVLHGVANEEMSAYQFRETIMGHACNWGNGYAEIERDQGGRVKALWPLLPDRTWLERDKTTLKLRYRTVLANGEVVILPFENVLHIAGFGFDGLTGYNPILMAREAIGLSLATESFGSLFFANGANTSGIVEYPEKLNDVAYDRYKKEVREAHEGLGNSHRLMLLQSGMTFKQATIPPDAAQFLETRKFQIAEIARIFRVPLHMLNEMSGSTNNNIEHQSIEYVMHTLRPWLVRWEQAIGMKLFTSAERKKGLFVEHQVDGLLRGDYKSRQEGLAIQRQNGVINANQWRSIENMNPQDGGQGEVYLVNGNMITVEKASQPREGGEPTK
jgi:HK97 family phage portal protein